METKTEEDLNRMRRRIGKEKTGGGGGLKKKREDEECEE